MTKKLSKKAIYLTVGVSVAVVFIAVFVGIFVLGPQREAIRSVDDRISEVERALVDPKTNGRDSNISKLNEKLSSAKKSIGRYVISSEQASDLTVDIGKIAKQAGLQELYSTNRMQGSYGPINECRYIREGRMQIKFKSSFSQFAKFINLLELNEPVIFVDTFTIVRSAKNDGMHSVDMTLTFFVGQGSLTNIMAVSDFLSAPVPAARTESAVN